MTVRSNLVLVTPPAEQPVTLAEAKAQLRVTSASEDAQITAIIKRATAHLERSLEHAFVTQTWRMDVAAFPDCREVWLPLEPVQSVTSVTYYDAANVLQTLDVANYGLYRSRRGWFVELANGVSWPSAYARPDAVKILFVAGYGAAASVPDDVKQAILLLVSKLYSTSRSDALVRSETVDGVGSRTWGDSGAMWSGVDKAIESLMMPYRRMWV